MRKRSLHLFAARKRNILHYLIFYLDSILCLRIRLTLVVCDKGLTLSKKIALAPFTGDIGKSICNLIPEKMYSLFTQRPISNGGLPLTGTQGVVTQSNRMVSIRFDTK